jgi:Mg-chelatase subunit ChlD
MKGRLRTRLGMMLMLGAVLVTPVNDAGGGTSSISLDVVFALDQSGSMRQNDPQRLVIQAATDFVRRLGPNDAAGLVVFGGQAKATHPLSPLSAEEKRKGLLDAIAGIRYGDPRTNMAAGIERGTYELKQHGRAAASAVLIFLTDGIMDTGSQAKDAEMREWLRTRLLPEARAP